MLGDDPCAVILEWTAELEVINTIYSWFPIWWDGKGSQAMQCRGALWLSAPPPLKLLTKGSLVPPRESYIPAFRLEIQKMTVTLFLSSQPAWTIEGGEVRKFGRITICFIPTLTQCWRFPHLNTWFPVALRSEPNLFCPTENQLLSSAKPDILMIKQSGVVEITCICIFNSPFKMTVECYILNW
jgi:hypothetical protein